MACETMQLRIFKLGTVLTYAFKLKTAQTRSGDPHFHGPGGRFAALAHVVLYRGTYLPKCEVSTPPPPPARGGGGVNETRLSEYWICFKITYNFGQNNGITPKLLQLFSLWEQNRNRIQSNRKSDVSNMVTLRVTIIYDWLRQVIASERK